MKKYWKYLTAAAIALNLQSSVEAQIETSKSKQLASEWSSAVLLRTLESPTEVNAIEFSPNGQLLASVGASQTTIWNVEKEEIQRVLPGHYASDIGMEIAPTAIAFSPNSRFLATATWSQGLLNPDRSIIVRDVTTGTEVLGIDDLSGCRQVVFDPAGTTLYGACELGVTAWSFPDGKKLFSFDTEYPVEAIALSPDGKVMATVDANVSGGQQGEQSELIQLWQLERSPTLLNTLEGHTNEIVKVEFTADGRRLVSSSYDGKINVWNWREGTSDRNTNSIYSKEGVFSLNADGRLIAGNFDSSMMSDLTTGLPLRNVLNTPTKATKETSLVAFSSQEGLFARVQNNIASNSVIELWSSDNSQSTALASVRDEYRAVPVIKYWSYREGNSPSQPKINKPSAIGKDPEAIARSALSLKEATESEREQIAVEYPSGRLARIIITQTNLADDSVADRRYLIEFAPYGDRADEKWQVVWVGQRFKCRLGRGQQNWGTDLCN